MPFEIIKANLTQWEAEESFPNNHIVFLAPRKGGNDTMGDIIYVGDVDGAWNFTDPIEPPDGYSFYMLRGINLRELAPIEVI